MIGGPGGKGGIGNDATQQLIAIISDKDKYLQYLQNIASKEEALKKQQAAYDEKYKEFAAERSNIIAERANLENEKVAFQNDIVNLKLELEAKNKKLDEEITEKLARLEYLESLKIDLENESDRLEAYRNGIRQKEGELSRREHAAKLMEDQVKKDKAEILKAKQLFSQFSSL